MALRAPACGMVDRSQSEFRLQGPKHRFQIGQHHIRAPELFRGELLLVAAQTIDARIGHYRARFRRLCPRDGLGPLAVLIRLHFYLVMLSDAAEALLQSADTFPYEVDALVRLRPGKPIGKLAEGLIPVAPRVFPGGPGQIRTCALTHPGSSLGSRATA